MSARLGSMFTAATIHSPAKGAQSEPTSLYTRGRAADTAKTFVSRAFNVSTRPRTTATATWQPVAWTTVGAATAAQRTPDLTSVIQEVVSRPGWAYGNALAIIINGFGLRTAYTYDGSATLAPLLHVEFTPPPN